MMLARLDVRCVQNGGKAERVAVLTRRQDAMTRAVAYSGE